jgi:hypothetical protein
MLCFARNVRSSASEYGNATPSIILLTASAANPARWVAESNGAGSVGVVVDDTEG